MLLPNDQQIQIDQTTTTNDHLSIMSVDSEEES
jgi:hypothetical protein